MLTQRTTILLQIFLILFFTVLAYYPSLKGGFIPLDDDVMVSGNQQIRNLTPSGITKMFSSVYKGLYHPIVTLSYAVEFNYFRLDPKIYRMTNLYLHAFNCIFVFWLFYLLTGNSWTAFIISMLFGIHPIHTESVAWISERKDVLYAFFFLLSLIAYVKMMESETPPAGAGGLFYCANNLRVAFGDRQSIPQQEPGGLTWRTKNARLYLISLLFFVLSALSKPMAVTLPFFITLIIYYKNEEKNSEHVLKLAPFFGLTLLFALAAYFAHYGSGQEPGFAGFAKNTAGVIYNYAFYFCKLIFPAKLYVWYPDILKNRTLTYVEILTPLFAILAIIILLARSLRFNPNFASAKFAFRKVVLGAGIFIIGLLPVIGFMRVGIASIADRYAYIPSIGLFYLFSEVVVSLFGALKNKPARQGFIIIITCIFCVFFLLTRARAEKWADCFKLFDETIKRYPMKNHEMYNCRGLANVSNGNIDAAKKDFESAISINKWYNFSYINLGNIYFNRGDMDNCYKYFYAAFAINPFDIVACCDMEFFYYNKKDYDKALFYTDTAIGRNPENISLLERRSNINFAENNYDKVFNDCLSILKLDPNNPGAHNFIGDCYLKVWDLNNAESEYKSALFRDSDNPLINCKIGLIASEKKDFGKAIKFFNKALSAEPGIADTYQYRANAYMISGGTRAAMGDLIAAYKFNRSSSILPMKLAVIYYDMEKYKAARRYLNEALKKGCKPDKDFIAKLNSKTSSNKSAAPSGIN